MWSATHRWIWRVFPPAMDLALINFLSSFKSLHSIFLQTVSERIFENIFKQKEIEGSREDFTGQRLLRLEDVGAVLERRRDAGKKQLNL